MNISVILAHPDKASFNHAIAKSVIDQLERNGHNVSFHDLYAEHFDPLLQVAEIPRAVVLPAAVKDHCEEIRCAEGIVVVHPNWWGQPPALLKGWIDRIIRPGVAYEFLEGDAGEGVPKGLLKAHAAIVFNTSNTTPEREHGVFGDPLETIWRNCIFGLCGVPAFYRRTFAVVVTSTEDERKQWLEEVTETVDRCFPKTGGCSEFRPARSRSSEGGGEMDIRITEAAPEDAAEILALQKLVYQSEAKLNDDWTIPPLTQTLSEIEGEFKTMVFLKVPWKGRVIASVRASLDSGTCRIGRLIVHPDFQGRGVGSALMGRTEDAFPSAERFELFTGTKSVDNIRLYERLGYREYLQKDLSPRVRLVFMEKRRERTNVFGATNSEQ
jgi:NAD(P)H dehydrogenase (quinone)